MRLFTGKNRGAISVFLCLILLPVLVFCGIIVDASRLFASKTVVSAAGDLTMNAALSAYDKELKDKYGLLAMAEKPESPKMKESFLQYFRESCNGALYLEQETGEEEKIHSMIQLEAEDKEFEAKGVESSSLGQYNVLKQQIIEYMKFRGPVYIIDDIVEKFKKLPLDKMEEKQEYIEKKSEYGQKVSKLGKPLEKAKKEIDNYIEAWNKIDGLLQGGEPGFAEEYRSKIVFWLAGKSAEMYLNGEYVDVPWENDDMLRIPEDSATIAANIAGDITWTESTFDQDKFNDIMAAISVYRQSDILAGGMTEENGFPEEIIEKFFNLYSTCHDSKEEMMQVYSRAVSDYIDSCDKLQKELNKNIKKMLDASEKAQKALEEVKKKYEEAEQVKKEYESLGQKLEIGNETIEDDNVTIDMQALEELKLCLSGNQAGVESLGNALEQKISSYQTIPGKITESGLDSVQAGYLSRYTESSAVELILSEKGIYWDSMAEETSLCDPAEQTFYKETLAEIGQKTDAPEEKNRDDARNEAKKNQEAYKAALKAARDLASAKNLASEQVEQETGFAYPEDYPGAGKSEINTDEIKDNTVEVKGDNVNDNSIVEDSGNSMGGIEGLLNAIDELTGSTLEKAYIVEYVTEMFNCYTTGMGEEKGNVQSLSGESLFEHYIQAGEMEYILYGNPKTANNVTYAVSQTFAIRLGINSVYTFLDKEKNTIANGIASAISTSTGSPWLYPIIKYGYLFCIALSDSGSEVTKLLAGEAVQIVPGKEFKDITLTYKEYLKLYILCAVLSDKGEKDIVMRAADCIQLNTKSKLSEKYTMVSLKATVKSSTTFLPKVPAFLGEQGKETDGKKSILYRSVLAY